MRYATAMVALVITLGVTESAEAQLNPARRSFLNQVFNRPTVSPYLNLVNPGGGGFQPNYHTLVRPLLQQQSINRQNALDLRRLQQRVTTNTQARLQTDPTGLPGTGHPTRFMFYGSYYSQLNRR